MKIVLITGANKGIGLETTKKLSKKGLYVYIGSRNIEKGNHAVRQLNQVGLKNIKAVELDVTNLDTILAAKHVNEKEQGILDVLINNAGILGSFPQSADAADIENFKEVYDTNVYGVIRVTQVFLELLKESAESRIVNVSSSLGSLTLHSDLAYKFYDVKTAVYNSSKAALNMYTVNLAYELRNTAFKVNAVCHGYTKTDFGNQIGTGDVTDAAERIIKYSLIDSNGPTGTFLSEEINPKTDIIPW